MGSMRDESTKPIAVFAETPEQYEARMKWLGERFEERVRRNYKQQRAERSIVFRLWLGTRYFAKTLQYVFVRFWRQILVTRVPK